MNPNRIGTRRALIVSLAAVAVLLSGCSADPATEPDPTPEPTTEPTAEPTEEPTEEPTAIDCLEDGTWYDDAAVRYQTLSEDLAAKGEVHTLTTSGDLTYDFDDGTLTVTYLAWMADFSMLATELGEYAVMHLENGPTTAPYTATETEITVLEADVSALAVEYVSTGAAPRATDEEMVEGVKGFIARPISWTYTCSPDELVLTKIVSDGSTPTPIALHHR